MELIPDAELVDYGCDYIRLTAPTGLILGCVVDGIAEGEEVPGVWRDYKGNWYCDGAMFFGARHDGAILQVSGTLAKSEELIGLVSVNCTRIDAQMTMLISTDATSHIDTLYDYIARMKRIGASPPNVKVTTIRSEGGGSTLYIGSRTSERMVRIYDKGREGKGDDGTNKLRFEVEYKGSLARAVYEKYTEHTSLLDTCIAETWRTSQRYHCVVSEGLQIRGEALPTASDKATSISSTLRWLAHGVRPAIERAKVSGVAPSHLRYILGLDPLDDI